MIPLILIGVVPLITGDIVKANFLPLVPLAHDAAGKVTTGSWNMAGWTVVAGGMFLAAWSTYGFETAVCYTGEFKDPKTDTFKAIFYSGLLCVVVFTLVPFAFQGFLGLGHLVKPAVLDAHGAVVGPPSTAACWRPTSTAAWAWPRSWRRWCTRRQHRRRIRDRDAGAGAGAVADDLDGRLFAHALPGLGRRLAAEVSRKLNSHGAPTQRDVDRPVLQPDPAADVGLCVRAGGRECRLPDLQLPESERRLDPRMDRPEHVRPWRAPSWILAAGAVLASSTWPSWAWAPISPASARCAAA